VKNIPKKLPIDADAIRREIRVNDDSVRILVEPIIPLLNELGTRKLSSGSDSLSFM
jgi:hypothetical protein